jgi:putative transposase
MQKVVGNEVGEDEVDGRSLLDEIAREGARRMLVAALEAEVAAYLEAHRDERDGDGHALVVRNGKGRTRKVTLGAGTIPLSALGVNDRRTEQDGERRRFTSRILPPYMRRSPKVAEVLPVLYLRGLSSGVRLPACLVPPPTPYAALLILPGRACSADGNDEVTDLCRNKSSHIAPHDR